MSKHNIPMIQINDKIINFLNNQDFDDEYFTYEFIETTKKTWKNTWYIFNNDSNWKNIIKSCLLNLSIKELSIIFKNSPNSIYDFIVGGCSFGSVYIGYSSSFNHSDTGVMLLQIENNLIYCYYKIVMNKGSIFMKDNDERRPYELTLCLADNINDLVEHCIPDDDKIKLFKFNNNIIYY